MCQRASGRHARCEAINTCIGLLIKIPIQQCKPYIIQLPVSIPFRRFAARGCLKGKSVELVISPVFVLLAIAYMSHDLIMLD